MAAPRSYALYLYASDAATPIAPGIVVSAYPWGSPQTDANLVDRSTVEPGSTTGTTYFNNLVAGLEYALVSNDGSFTTSYFRAGADGQATVVSGATPPSGGGSSPVVYKVIGAGIGTFADATGVSAASGAQTALLTTAMTYTPQTGDDQLGQDFFTPQNMQFYIRETPPDAAGLIRYVVKAQATLAITPPATGKQFTVQLGLVEASTGGTLNGQQSFSDTVTVTALSSAQLVLSAEYVAMSSVASPNFLDFVAKVAVACSDGTTPLAISDVSIGVHAIAEAIQTPAT